LFFNKNTPFKILGKDLVGWVVYQHTDQVVREVNLVDCFESHQNFAEDPMGQEQWGLAVMVY
jgi:hypothetical protein